MHQIWESTFGKWFRLVLVEQTNDYWQVSEVNNVHKSYFIHASNEQVSHTAVPLTRSINQIIEIRKSTDIYRGNNKDCGWGCSLVAGMCPAFRKHQVQSPPASLKGGFCSRAWKEACLRCQIIATRQSKQHWLDGTMQGSLMGLLCKLKHWGSACKYIQPAVVGRHAKPTLIISLGFRLAWPVGQVKCKEIFINLFIH